MNIKNTAHFVMQSKGGAGKSVVSALLAQYLLEHDKDLILIDTDPSNKTLGSYKALAVQKIEVLNKNKLVDQSKFDSFMNDFLEANSPMLVDTGSGDFLAINNYMMQNDIPTLFKEMGKQMFIHVPINYGQSKDETLKCLFEIAVNHKNVIIVAWENEFFAAAEEALAETPLMKKLGNVAGIVTIREMNADTEQQDFSNMLKNSLTFEEVRQSEDKAQFGFMQKTRIERIRKEIWQQLNDLFGGIDNAKKVKPKADKA